MARWQNFSIWRGRLPHWRADDVNYYVTFKHQRELEMGEREILFSRLFRAQRSKLDFALLCVRPKETEMVFQVKTAPSGEVYELSDVIEKAKKKAGAQIIKKSGERWPPFYIESFDRIIRDDAEFEELWLKILESVVTEELATEPEEYMHLWVANDSNTGF